MAIASSPYFKRIFTSISTAGMIAGIVASAGIAQTPTATPSQRATAQPSPTGSPPATPSATATPSVTPTATPTATPEATLTEQLKKAWQASQLPFMMVGGTLAVYLLVLAIRPKWLLKLPATDLAIPFTTWKVPLNGVRWLKYRSRVLDAWVADYWEIAQKQFKELPTVKDRQIHISLPVNLDRKLVENLTEKELSAVFQKKTAVVLIAGEGGAGKTSLACQIALWGLNQQLANHRLLPVLVETELDDKKTLLELIRGQLKILTNQSEPPDAELVQSLLQRQRVLVIVDHLSEMSEATRKQITPDRPDFLANALIVTSRLPESLDGVPKLVVEPLRIEGNSLSRFMGAYLDQRHKRHLFEDEDYIDACRRLSRIVGQRNITILLVRLYVDQMIELQQGSGGTLPASVPELMLSYVNRLNQTIEPANRRDILQVQRDAKGVAWECLKVTYRPTTAKTEQVITALAETGDRVEAQKRLEYLEKRLRLVQTLEPGDQIKIILDPLAEYLAAAWFVDQIKNARQRPADALWDLGTATHTTGNDSETRETDPQGALWQRFFRSIEQHLEAENLTPKAIQGFLLAVRDCCLLEQKQAAIPSEIIEELARQAGENPDDLREKEEKRRIRLLISELAAPELEYRLLAARALAQHRAKAANAVPNLRGMLTNPNQALEARQAAAKTLASIGGRNNNSLRDEIGACFLKLMADPSEDLAVRRSIAEALGLMQTGQAQLLQILDNQQEPLPLRQGAASALSLIGAASGDPVPMLIVTRHQQHVTTQVKRIPVFRTQLTEDLSIHWVDIPGGQFLMGSPPDEEGRDYYQYNNFPETEGLDVEIQHPVTVPPFRMSQYPITQAQWRFVAGLPKVNRDLNPYPSNFKGDDHPVENVSWYDAQEFCARLTQHTGQTHRLPSEAEWEYACRAETTSPFHFGETLTSDWSNYHATYTYGDGVVGEFRNQTTAVGSFGVVNAYGLADMHGNVYEWCEDAWQPSYANTPTDGSAWQAENENDNRYRVLRGGSCFSYPAFCRCAFRNRNHPADRLNYIGFRVVAVLSP